MDNKIKLNLCIQSIRNFYPTTPEGRILYIKIYDKCIELINNISEDEYDYIVKKKGFLKMSEFIAGAYYQVANGYHDYIKEKFSNKCIFCGFDDFDILEVNHIIPRSMGGKNDESNLLAVCPNCHKIIHIVERLGIITEDIKSYYIKKGTYDIFLFYLKHLLKQYNLLLR